MCVTMIYNKINNACRFYDKADLNDVLKHD